MDVGCGVLGVVVAMIGTGEIVILTTGAGTDEQPESVSVKQINTRARIG
jgi:hypothetical protein